MHETPAWRWLDLGGVRHLGAISYPLYLYHICGHGLALKMIPTAPTIVRLTVAIGASVLLATLSYRFIEPPFMRLKKRLSSSQAEREIALQQPTVGAKRKYGFLG